MLLATKERALLRLSANGEHCLWSNMQHRPTNIHRTDNLTTTRTRTRTHDNCDKRATILRSWRTLRRHTSKRNTQPLLPNLATKQRPSPPHQGSHMHPDFEPLSQLLTRTPQNWISSITLCCLLFLFFSFFLSFFLAFTSMNTLFLIPPN